MEETIGKMNSHNYIAECIMIPCNIYLCNLHVCIQCHAVVGVGSGCCLVWQTISVADIPCVGVAKKLYHVDGIRKGPEHKEKVLTSALSFSLSQFTTSLSALSCRVFIENVIACHC